MIIYNTRGGGRRALPSSVARSRDMDLSHVWDHVELMGAAHSAAWVQISATAEL